MISRFANERSALLNPPASIADIERANIKYGELFSSASEIYRLFDGEIGCGAWLPGFSIYSLAQQSEVFDALNFDLDDADEFYETLRNFLPLIGTEEKSDIGLVGAGASFFAGHVIEFEVESGNIKVWAKSFSEFVSVFLEFSLEFNRNPRSDTYDPIAFNKRHFDFLRSRGVTFTDEWIESA